MRAMKKPLSVRVYALLALFAATFAVFAFIPSNRVLSQGLTFERIRKVLEEGAGFTDSDLASLEKGDVVVRELSPTDPREIAFTGAVKINAPRDVVFEAFRRAIEAQEKEIAISRGIFRSPPSAKELAKLQIESGEIRSLARCEKGDCDWSLSGELIEKIRNEVDWNSGGAEGRASELFKEILAGYTADYLRNGDEALMVYEDDPEPLDLRAEYESLLGNLLLLDDLAPEFHGYLREFPRKQLDGVDDFVSWSNVQIALKPVVVNTHTIFYKKEAERIPQAFILSKQIYANHYFHSSLALTTLVSFPRGDDQFDTYVIFSSHSRTGALSGTIGQIARSAVDGQAESKLTSALEDTKRYTKYTLEGISETEQSSERGIFGWVFNVYSLILLTAAALFLVFVVRKLRGTSS